MLFDSFSMSLRMAFELALFEPSSDAACMHAFGIAADSTCEVEQTNHQGTL